MKQAEAGEYVNIRQSEREFTVRTIFERFGRLPDARRDGHSTLVATDMEELPSDEGGSISEDIEMERMNQRIWRGNV